MKIHAALTERCALHYDGIVEFTRTCELVAETCSEIKLTKSEDKPKTRDLILNYCDLATVIMNRENVCPPSDDQCFWFTFTLDQGNVGKRGYRSDRHS